MGKYQIEFSDESLEDLDRSFEWGCGYWGVEEATGWYFKMRDAIPNGLELFPLRHPIAPENEQYSVEVRQMIHGRYRILFNVSGRIVTVLHIRGPYSG